jgi:hypothetical protein
VVHKSWSAWGKGPCSKVTCSSRYLSITSAIAL